MGERGVGTGWNEWKCTCSARRPLLLHLRSSRDRKSLPPLPFLRHPLLFSPDEGENDSADSSARFSYSWYNNDDNDNNNGNDYVSETASLSNERLLSLCVGKAGLSPLPDLIATFVDKCLLLINVRLDNSVGKYARCKYARSSRFHFISSVSRFLLSRRNLARGNRAHGRFRNLVISDQIFRSRHEA